MGLFGHVHTVAPVFRDRLARRAPPPSEPFSVAVHDPSVGAVPLTGRLARGAVPGRLAILVHGLGGSAESAYVVRLASALHAVGISTLRWNMRGADGSGADFYHAGLTADLAATLDAPELAEFERVALVGFSLGGHLALKWATEAASPRVAAVAAVCPPLDLAPGARALDELRRRPYLRYVLSGLVASYERVAARRSVPVPVAEARAIRSIITWDERIVAPRHGFRSAHHYYAEASAGPHLGAIAVPTLIVVGDDDPMIPLSIVRPALARVSPRVDARVVRGGHVGFPAALDLGERAARGIEPQLAAWTRARLA